jgi:RNA polymerase sigma-B factor
VSSKRGLPDDATLAHRLRRGDERAREALIARHLPLARALAGRYRRSAVPQEDLVQVASLGLVLAAGRWDPARGTSFPSYAVPTILGELRHYFRDATWAVRPPRRLQDLSMAVERVREPLNAATQRDATVTDIAERLGRSAREVDEALQATSARTATSLESLVQSQEGDVVALGDLIGRSDHGYEEAEARATVERLTAGLDARARRILSLRFDGDLAQAEIGQRVGLSQMHVSRIIKRSLEQLAGDADAPLAA